MRRGFLRAVSSALLLVSLVFMPHPGVGLYDARSLVLGSGALSPVISEFYPCALAGDEYLSISGSSDTGICLRNWSVTDGEGEIRFLAEIWLLPGRTITVSFNSTSFWCAYNRMPDLSLESAEMAGLVAVSGSFRLADVGDSLALVSPSGLIIDEVVYGSIDSSATGWTGTPIPTLRKGEVAKRIESNGRPVDTDTASDWMPFREYRYGYTEFEPRRFEVAAGCIVAFTSPDSSFDVVTAALDQAENTISICTYEFSSLSVCKRLLGAIGRGVDVRLLVDGAPAGDMDDKEITCLSVLRTAGANVRGVNGNQSSGIVQHVGALHSKYIVIDSAVSIVMTENIVEDGLPENRIVGNRGWAVMITDPGLAGYLLDLFDSDFRRSRPDVRDWRKDYRFNDGSALAEVRANTSATPLIAPLVSTEQTSATLVVSPDASVLRPFLLDHFRASRSVAVEQFQADLYWTSRWTGEKHLNPMIQSLLTLESRGVTERVLLDSSWFNIERNRQVIDCLNGNSTSDSSQYRLLNERSPITLLHNKGVVVDGTVSAITSNNWVSASFSRNRELAVIIESEEVASYFMRAMEYDFIPDETAPTCDAGPDVELSLGKSIVLNADKCSDDRQILGYCWDFDADGTTDSEENKALFSGAVPGEHTVVLEVTDAWGNSATDEMRVRVILPETEESSELQKISRVLWLGPIVVVAGLLLMRGLRSRRSNSGSRNINHRPRS